MACDTRARVHEAAPTRASINAAAGGKTVAQFHLHLVARHADDGVSFAWPRKEPAAEVIAGYAVQLRAALGSP